MWLYHILSVASYSSRKSFVFVSIFTVRFIMCANNWLHCGLKVVFLYLHITLFHYHHYAELIWKYWTYKMLVRYIRTVECVSKTPIYYSIYGVVSHQLTHFSFDNWANVCTKSYHFHQVENMNHWQCSGLGHNTVVWTVCLAISL